VTDISASADAAVGVLGGTFDPIHHGHLRLAVEMRARLGLAELRLIPLNQPAHRRSPLAPSALRAEMIEIAIRNEPGLRLDRREIDRGGVSYTLDTLRSLREELGMRPLYLILGLDAFLGLPAWKNWEEIPTLCHLAIAYRPGWELELAQDLRDQLLEPHRRPGSPGGDVRFECVPPLDISSSQIRATLAAGGSARYLVPDAVLELIRLNRIYLPNEVIA
jgi:nicotinate-nucleotide adenylyltransferase